MSPHCPQERGLALKAHHKPVPACFTVFSPIFPLHGSLTLATIHKKCLSPRPPWSFPFSSASHTHIHAHVHIHVHTHMPVAPSPISPSPLHPLPLTAWVTLHHLCLCMLCLPRDWGAQGRGHIWLSSASLETPQGQTQSRGSWRCSIGC